MRKNIIKMVVLLGGTWLLLGCSSKSAKEFTLMVDNFLSRGNGSNEGSKRYRFTSAQAVNEYLIDAEHFTAKPLLTKEDDWKDMGTWKFIYNYAGTTTLNNRVSIPGKYYGAIILNIGISNRKVREYDTVYHNALKSGDEAYFKNKYPYFKDKRTGEERKINVHIEFHGKENYPCLVRETIHGKQLTQLYSCYKSNQDRTLENLVVIRLTYSSMIDIETKYPYFAEKYSYEDFKERAKTTLDSLYIKDF